MGVQVISRALGRDINISLGSAHGSTHLHRLLGGRDPRLGDTVLYHPENVSDGTVSAFPAIIHFISEAERRLRDLTVFTTNGPKVVQDLPFAPEWTESHWTFRGAPSPARVLARPRPFLPPVLIDNACS
jgi:hypothetical protein